MTGVRSFAPRKPSPEQARLLASLAACGAVSGLKSIRLWRHRRAAVNALRERGLLEAWGRGRHTRYFLSADGAELMARQPACRRCGEALVGAGAASFICTDCEGDGE